MAKDQINIPVALVGGAEVYTEINAIEARIARARTDPVTNRAVLSQIRQNALGGEGVSITNAASVANATAAAAAVDRVAQSTRTAGEESSKSGRLFEGFSMAGRRGLMSLLLMVDPTIGHITSLVLGMTQTIGKASAALLGMAGVGAALGAIVAIFTSIAAAAERAEQAIRQAHQARMEAAKEAASAQVEVSDALKEAGILGRGAAASATMQGLMKQGIDRKTATFAAVAQQVKGLSEDETKQIAGAYLATGSEAKFSAEKPGDHSRNISTVDRLLRFDREKAQQALAARIADVGDEARAEAEVIVTTREERALARGGVRVVKSGFANEEDVVAAQQVARGGDVLAQRSIWRRILDSLGPADEPVFGEASPEAKQYLREQEMKRIPAGGTRSRAETLARLKQEADYVRGQSEVPGEAVAGPNDVPTAPVYNVTNYISNVSQQYNGSQGLPGVQSVHDAGITGY